MSCPDCFKGAIHDHAEPQGRMETLYGLKTYVTGNSDSKNAILYLPDAFSLKLVNNKLLADRYAAGTGCKVLFPDVVPGGGVDIITLGYFDTIMEPLPSWSIGAIGSKIWAYFAILPIMVPFMVKMDMKKAYATILKYARDMYKDLPEGGKLGVAGFCWGGYSSTHLCGETAVEGGSEPLISAQFNGHPSALKAPDMLVDSISKFKVPYLSAVAENDFGFNEKAALQTEAALREKVGVAEECNYKFTIYKSCTHGFCVRAKPGTPGMDGYHAAANEAIAWFNKYLSDT